MPQRRVPEADTAIRAGIDDRRIAVSRKRGAKSLKMRERRHVFV